MHKKVQMIFGILCFVTILCLSIVVISLIQIYKHSTYLMVNLNTMQSLFNREMYENANNVCEHVDFRKGYCYGTMYQLILNKLNKNETVPYEKKFCDNLIIEKTHPFWHFILTTFVKDDYNNKMIILRNECLSRLS